MSQEALISITEEEIQKAEKAFGHAFYAGFGSWRSFSSTSQGSSAVFVQVLEEQCRSMGINGAIGPNEADNLQSSFEGMILKNSTRCKRIDNYIQSKLEKADLDSMFLKLGQEFLNYCRKRHGINDRKKFCCPQKPVTQTSHHQSVR